MKRPEHEKSLLGHVPPGTLASSSERFTKSLARQLHTWPNQPAAKHITSMINIRVWCLYLGTPDRMR
ncbi:MAG: hypothetical protein KTR25_07795 [Myxococcales bacterium]|nr:hypothetical protein [Myxococcales bacterium]